MQCKPGNEQKLINEYEAWGWEVVSNQRCQETEVRTEDGERVEYYVTFSKITLSRDKDAPWYNEVKKAQETMETNERLIEHYRERVDEVKTRLVGKEPKKPYKPSVKSIVFSVIAIIIGIIAMVYAMNAEKRDDVIAGWLIFGAGIALAVVLTTLFIVRSIKFKTDTVKYENWKNAESSRSKELNNNAEYKNLSDTLYRLREERDKLLNRVKKLLK